MSAYYYLFSYYYICVLILLYVCAYSTQVASKWLFLFQHLSVTFRDGVKVLPPSPGHNHGGHLRGGPVANMLDGSGSGNFPKSQLNSIKKIKNKVQRYDEI